MTKGHHYEYFYPWLGNGLAFSIGDFQSFDNWTYRQKSISFNPFKWSNCAGQKWKSRRRLLTPTFHFKALEGFVDVYHKHMVTLSTFFDAHCQPPGQYNTVNVFPYLNSFALDVVSGKCPMTTWSNWFRCPTRPNLVQKSHADPSLYVDAVMGIEMNAQTKQDNGYSKRLQRFENERLFSFIENNLKKDSTPIRLR